VTEGNEYNNFQMLIIYIDIISKFLVFHHLVILLIKLFHYQSLETLG